MNSSLILVADLIKQLSTDFERESESIVKKFLKDLSKAPASKQFAVGTGAGWLVGYITMKVGKAAATAIGGSLLLLQAIH